MVSGFLSLSAALGLRPPAPTGRVSPVSSSSSCHFCPLACRFCPSACLPWSHGLSFFVTFATRPRTCFRILRPFYLSVRLRPALRTHTVYCIGSNSYRPRSATRYYRGSLWAFSSSCRAYLRVRSALLGLWGIGSR